VGGYYGGRLAQHGNDVHFLLRSDYETVATHGWTIRSCDGDFDLSPSTTHVYRRSEDMPRADLVIVTLKATANDQFEPLIRPLLKPNTVILTLQNGLGNEERLADLFGPERVVGGLAFVCIYRLGPGLIHHMDHGQVKIGEFANPNTSRAEAIIRLLRDSGIKCELLESLRHGRWEKLVWNIPFNGLGAALDLTTDRLIGSPEGVALVRSLMAEVVAAALGSGVTLPASIIEQKVEQTQSMGPYKSSMQLDREMGRDMEIEAILGEPLRAARRAGIATPLLGEVYRMLQIVNLSRSGDLQ